MNSKHLDYRDKITNEFSEENCEKKKMKANDKYSRSKQFWTKNRTKGQSP